MGIKEIRKRKGEVKEWWWCREREVGSGSWGLQAWVIAGGGEGGRFKLREGKELSHRNKAFLSFMRAGPFDTASSHLST